PSSTSASAIDSAVEGALSAVGLGSRADTRVGALSGGERKRGGIAGGWVTDPARFFLGETTSGLGPPTSPGVIARLRGLADPSATVVFTTHSVEDLGVCDRIVFLARGGRVAFVGRVEDALVHFEVESVPALYERLAQFDVSSQASPGDAVGPARVVTRRT